MMKRNEFVTYEFTLSPGRGVSISGLTEEEAKRIERALLQPPGPAPSMEEVERLVDQVVYLARQDMSYEISRDDLLSAIRALPDRYEEGPPPVCTGSLTVDADFRSLGSSIPSHGRCGICGQSGIPLVMDGTSRIVTHPWRSLPTPNPEDRKP